MESLFRSSFLTAFSIMLNHLSLGCSHYTATKSVSAGKQSEVRLNLWWNSGKKVRAQRSATKELSFVNGVNGHLIFFLNINSKLPPLQLGPKKMTIDK
jgi:hypothetical protein